MTARATGSRPARDAITRRAVIGGAIAVGARFAVPKGAAAEPRNPAAMPTRAFGKTGRSVSVFGLGCFYVGAAPTDDDGVAVVRRALELGCTYFDTAPSYVNGVSERRVGLGLHGRRDRVFLATKTLERQGPSARRELEASLKRLRTDYVDLIQVHCVTDDRDLETVLSDRGPLPALVRAKEQGLARFIGVTAHREPAVAKAAIERWSWDSILLPLNPVDLHGKSFVTGALPTASKAGVGRVAMKVFASGRLVHAGRKAALAPEDCLRFAYGLDVSCAIVGCSTPAEVELAARVAMEAKTLDDAQKKALVEAAKPFSGFAAPDGVEWYKRP